jgi:hypothetical protein
LGGELPVENEIRLEITRGRLTHGDTVQLRVVGVQVIFVEKLFTHCNGSLDAQFVGVIAGDRGKVLVDVVHGWDHLCQVWRSTRKE